jgi:carboxypeptidase C (cathepsin A)
MSLSCGLRLVASPDTFALLMRILLSALILVAFCTLAPAQSRPSSRASGATSQPSDDDHLTVTSHQITLHGNPLRYETTAGTIAVKDDLGKARATFFFMAYKVISDPAVDVSKRPLTFVFNGGPGSASVWLHLGTVGPMRVNNSAEGDPGPPPHALVENQETWLDATDLVFIDPVGTGFSRPAEGVSPKEFWGVEQDISSVADFIRLYLTRYQRWNSPKFLAGESYGTTRAAGLSLYLTDHFGIDLNGIVLISTVLNFGVLEAGDGNDLPYAVFLPSYTAIAGYHKRLPPDLQSAPDQAVAAAEKWAMTDYTTALAAGKSLTPEAQTAIVHTLARYTGLSEDFIKKSRLRISPEAFRKHLLNDQEQILGRYDARLKAPDPTPATDDLSQDPSDSLYYPAYASAFNQYIRHDLKFETDQPYRVMAPVWPWDFKTPDQEMGYLDVSGRLRQAMLQEPHLHVLVAAGHYDLATPFASVDYTVSHMDLSKQISDRITQTYYPSGHMIYHVAEARQKLRADVGAFMAAAVPTTQP